MLLNSKQPDLPAMYTISKFDLKTWKKKRTRTFTVFCIVVLFLGMEYSMTFTTLLLYLKNMNLKESNLDVFYAAISAAYYISSIISSLIIGHLNDRIRCVRVIFAVCLALVVLGNILYSLPYSPHLLLTGRFIAGIGGAIRPVVSSEIARCYEGDEAIRAFSLVAIMFMIGFVIGPAINVAFVPIDFSIGYLPINYANVPGLFMAIIFILAEIIGMIFVSDLSKEYDPKGVVEMESKATRGSNSNVNLSSKRALDTTKSSEKKIESCTTELNFSVPDSPFKDQKTNIVDYFDDELGEDQPLLPRSSSQSPLESFLTLLSNVDSALIMITSMVCMFVLVSLDIWLPLMVVEILKWNVTALDIIMLGTGVSCTGVLAIVYFYSPSNKCAYTTNLLAVFMMALMEIIMLVIYLYKDDFLVAIASWVVYDILFGLTVTATEIFMVSTLSKMISSPYQSFGESVRQGFSQLGAVVALTTSVILFHVLVPAAVVLCIIVLFCGVCMIIRRNNIIHSNMIL